LSPLDSSMFPLFCKEGLGELEIEKSYFANGLYLTLVEYNESIKFLIFITDSG